MPLLEAGGLDLGLVAGEFASAALATRLEQARESTAANTVAAAPRADLIHPGAQKYFREIGLLRP